MEGSVVFCNGAYLLLCKWSHEIILDNAYGGLDRRLVLRFAHPGRRYNDAVMVHEVLVPLVEDHRVEVLAPCLICGRSTVVRHRDSRNTSEEFEGMLVTKKPGLHLLIRECLYIEIAAVGENHHKKVEMYRLLRVVVDDGRLVSNPVDLALLSWKLVEGNDDVVLLCVIGDYLVETRELVGLLVVHFRFYCILRPEFIPLFTLAASCEDLVAVWLKVSIIT